MISIPEGQQCSPSAWQSRPTTDTRRNVSTTASPSPEPLDVIHFPAQADMHANRSYGVGKEQGDRDRGVTDLPVRISSRCQAGRLHELDRRSIDGGVTRIQLLPPLAPLPANSSCLPL